jgi:hypothetical protein
MRNWLYGTLGMAVGLAVVGGCGSSTSGTTHTGKGGAGTGGAVVGIGGAIGTGGAPGTGGSEGGTADGSAGNGGNAKGGGTGTGLGGLGTGGGPGVGGGGLAGRPGVGGTVPVATTGGTLGGGTGAGGTPGTGGRSSTAGVVGTGGMPVAGGSAGRGGAPGTGGIVGTGGSAGNGGRSGTGGTGGGTGACLASCSSLFPTCCGGACVYTTNDPENCGGCGVRCEAGQYCNQGCQAVPCNRDGSVCISVAGCCGDTCCGVDQTCCATNSPVGPMRPVCFTPTADAPRCPGNLAVVSDHNLKKNLVAADVDLVLARLRELPMSTWSYLDEPATVRHLGPMAQDFRRSFGLGSDERSYSPVDGHGVSMAAIQALDRLVRAQQGRIESLERTNRALARRLDAVESRKRP